MKHGVWRISLSLSSVETWRKLGHSRSQLMVNGSVVGEGVGPPENDKIPWILLDWASQHYREIFSRLHGRGAQKIQEFSRINRITERRWSGYKLLLVLDLRLQE